MQRYTHKDWRLYAENQQELDAGNFYVSVTTILSIICGRDHKNMMIGMSSENYRETMDRTADIGTRLHNAIQADLMDKPCELSNDLQKPYQNWLALKAKESISAIEIEKVLASEEYGYAGSMDWMGFHGEAEAVFELKTGRYPITTGWQLAAYKKVVDPENVMKMRGIHVHRNGEDVGVFRYQHIDSCFNAFLSARNCFRMFYYNELKKLNWKFLNKE